MTWLMPIEATRPQPSAMKIRMSDFIRIDQFLFERASGTG
jgi:hypothetical protein